MLAALVGLEACGSRDDDSAVRQAACRGIVEAAAKCRREEGGSGGKSVVAWLLARMFDENEGVMREACRLALGAWGVGKGRGLDREVRDALDDMMLEGGR